MQFLTIKKKLQDLIMLMRHHPLRVLDVADGLRKAFMLLGFDPLDCDLLDVQVCVRYLNTLLQTELSCFGTRLHPVGNKSLILWEMFG